MAQIKLVAVFLGLLVCAMPATITAQPSGATAAAQIDTECAAEWSAVSQTSPVSVILNGKRWVILSDAQLASAVGSGTPHYAGVYKQSARYVYVREVSFDKYGQQHAIDLCYRSDGTLERARQAQTVAALSGETGQRAYYAADGTLIQKTPGFDVKDPTIALNVRDLRYFSVLPPP
jgi:hypothetical protein